MFRPSEKYPQQDLLSSPDRHLDERRLNQLHDSEAWHNIFFNHVVSQIDETVFEVLFEQQMGAPNASVKLLIGMMVIKEGFGFTDQQLFEAVRFHLLVRQALGVVNITDQTPTESTWYLFRKRIYEHEREHDTDLVGQAFRGVTHKQVLEFELDGQQIRMDSKLIGSNIAWQSRYELIHRTISAFWGSLGEAGQSKAEAGLQACLEDLCGEEAQKIVYRSSGDQLRHRLETLGEVMGRLVSSYGPSDSPKYELLERVFTEQYTSGSDSDPDSDEDGPNPQPRESRQISADSVQSPDDPECSYRQKADQQVKGYSVNLSETIGEDGELNLITDIRLAPANYSDSGFLGPAIASSEACTGQQVKTCYADGAYNRSLEAEQQAGQEHVEMVLSGIQGAASRFELKETSEGLQVSDTQTGQTHQAQPVRRQKNPTKQRWKIWLEPQRCWRYFDQAAIRASRRRRAIRGRSKSERNRRNNVEASIYHLGHTLKDGKTRYRGLFKNKLWASCKAFWVNMRRICRYMSQKDPVGDNTQAHTAPAGQPA